MTEMAKGSVTHQRLIALLSQEGANFRVALLNKSNFC